MFTFGREHERKCEAQYVRNPAQIPILLAVVDAVHDLIEGKGSEVAFESTIRSAFTDGGTGVWENAGKWLRKTGSEFPGVLKLWAELAAHPKAEIRFRVACFLNEVPASIFAPLSETLLKDKSGKVAQMAEARIIEVNGRLASQETRA
jgi:hypothetical protein